MEEVKVVRVNDIPTHVYHRQSGFENCSSMILVITGSPGVAHFYVPFVDRLHELWRGKHDVCVLGHAGHSPGVVKESDEVGGDWYSLEDQIEHKMAFINERAANKQLYLIGHSIGCYMILHLLELLPAEKVKKAVLLFPTIERISETPKGQLMKPFFTSFQWVLILAVWLLSIIPTWLQNLVMRLHFSTTPSEQLDSMRQGVTVIDPRVMYNVLNMANQELQVVKELPIDLIMQHLPRLTFYYGVKDHWNMSDSYSNMLAQFSNGDIVQCPHGYRHDFVLETSNQMADWCFQKIIVEEE